MKLGIAYNVFSATELLPYSVKQIRNIADHIIAVVQPLSYHGIPFSDENQEILHQLHQDKMIDEIQIVNTSAYKFNPKLAEAFKRNQGKNTLMKNGCTHFCTMDEDEIYFSDQFENAYNDFVQSGADASACQMQTYYKYPTLCLKEPESYYVPLFYKMDKRLFRIGQFDFPVVADPSRKLETRNFLEFERQQIEMHHYSFVRKDIRTKFNHSPSLQNYAKRIPEIVKRWDNYQEGDLALWSGSARREYELKQVENHFNIQI